LPLSGDLFSVPENVFIVGTMNTADRSIALLDVALRRRFGFIEIMPNYSILADLIIEGLPVAQWLEGLNQRIIAHAGRDARNLQIGHSYFLENAKPIRDFEKFRKIILEDILPLIEEYCYGDYGMISNIIGGGFVDKDKQEFNHAAFTASNKSALISALLEPKADIATSAVVPAEIDEIDMDSISGDLSVEETP